MKHLLTTALALSFAGLTCLASAESYLVVPAKLNKINHDLHQQQRQVLDALGSPSEPSEMVMLEGMFSAVGNTDSCLNSVANYLYIYAEISVPSERKGVLEIIEPEINSCIEMLGSSITLKDQYMSITQQKSTYLLAQSIRSNYVQAASLMRGIQFTP